MNEKTKQLHQLSQAWNPGTAQQRITEVKVRWHTMKENGQRIGKRTVDVAGSLMLLLLLSPVFALTALLIRLDDPGTIFFSQVRVGTGGRLFRMLKFRSMRMDAELIKKRLMTQNETGGVTFKMKHDPRITRVGRFIRKYSIDELPQIVNVLKGDMSLVGPRPAIPSEVAQYRWRQRQRLLVTPGLTCFWQVNGRSEIPFEQQVELDIRYIREQNTLTDMNLLVRTVPAVLLGKGAC